MVWISVFKNLFETQSWFWNPLKRKPSWYIKVVELGGNQPLILTLTPQPDPRFGSKLILEQELNWSIEKKFSSLFFIYYFIHFSDFFDIFLIFKMVLLFSIYFRLSEKFPDLFGLPFWLFWFWFYFLDYVPSFPDFLRLFIFKNKLDDFSDFFEFWSQGL